MPNEPDKIDVILGIVKELKAKFLGGDAIAPPDDPNPESEAQKFLKRWALVTPEEFKARYGVDHGQPIPPLAFYDEDEVIFRTRSFYDVWAGVPGYGFGFPADQVSDILYSINVVANANKTNATQFYECGKELALRCYPDTLAYSYYHGLIKTWKQFTNGFMVGPQPFTVADLTLEEKAAKPGGGGPGV